MLGVGIETDFVQIIESIERMDPEHHKREFQRIIFEGLGKMRDTAMSEIKQTIPYRRYPTEHNKRDYHTHGMLRGKQYGELAGDVKRSVSSDASGGSVNIYSKSDTLNRWCVLQWLNEGTLPRRTGGRTRIRADKQGRVSTKFIANSDDVNPGYRGYIEAQNFFIPAASRGIRSAEGYILDAAVKLISEQIND